MRRDGGAASWEPAFPLIVAQLHREKVQGENHREGTNQMVNPAGLLTAEERVRITDIQDLLIGLFLEHGEAVENRDNGRARTLQSEIDNLLREKEEIEKWAVVGSA
jgi:hypothetical protein